MPKHKINEMQAGNVSMYTYHFILSNTELLLPICMQNYSLGSGSMHFYTLFPCGYVISGMPISRHACILTEKQSTHMHSISRHLVEPCGLAECNVCIVRSCPCSHKCMPSSYGKNQDVTLIITIKDYKRDQVQR